MPPCSNLRFRWVRGGLVGITLGVLAGMATFPPGAQQFNCRLLAEPALENAVADAAARKNQETAGLEGMGLLDWSRYHPVPVALGGLVIGGEILGAWWLAGLLLRKRRWPW